MAKTLKENLDDIRANGEQIKKYTDAAPTLIGLGIITPTMAKTLADLQDINVKLMATAETIEE